MSHDLREDHCHAPSFEGQLKKGIPSRKLDSHSFAMGVYLFHVIATDSPGSGGQRKTIRSLRPTSIREMRETTFRNEVHGSSHQEEIPT